MTETTSALEILARAGGVKRYHIWSIIGEQTNAHHSWGVAALIAQLWPNATKELILAALHHDIPEFETGDIPMPTKKIMGAPLKEVEQEIFKKYSLTSEHDLQEADRVKLKIADSLELVLFSTLQIKIGNTTMLPILESGLKKCVGKFRPTS